MLTTRRKVAAVAALVILAATACSSGNIAEGKKADGTITITVGQKPTPGPGRRTEDLDGPGGRVREGQPERQDRGLRDNVQVNLFMAGLLISVVLPIVIFLLFQRYFIRGAGLAGGIKG